MKVIGINSVKQCAKLRNRIKPELLVLNLLKLLVDVIYTTGQAIPAGLHVRLNMETGEREAKLMEGDDRMKYWSTNSKQGTDLLLLHLGLVSSNRVA